MDNLGLAPAASETAQAQLPEQTTAFPTPPAYADAQDSGPEGLAQQMAAVDPAQMQPEAAVSVTTDYAPAIAQRARAIAFSSRDHECLARAMYFESNRSSREGMVAVGSVVMNRLKDGRWGSTVCQVVGAPKQFAPGVLTRSMDSDGAPLAMEASRSVLKGERHPRIYDDVMFFHTAGYKFSYDNMHYVAVAGGNSFYEKRRRMRGRPNTSQSAIMAMTQTPLQAAKAAANPIKKALKRPVRAVQKVLPLSKEEEGAAPIPASAPTQRPAAIEQPDATRFGDLDAAAPAIKTGRLPRKSKTLAPEL